MCKFVDILVPVRNEEDNIHTFISKISSVNIKGVNINVIFIEDGSTDGTLEVLRDYSDKNKKINYISLDNRYGQYAALIIGMKLSNADAIITMDVDGGHPVEVVEKMINKYLNGINVVQGKRELFKRKKKYRAIASYIYSFLFFLIVGVNVFKQNVMFRLLDKNAKQIFLNNKSWWHIFKTNFRKHHNLKIEYVNYTAEERILGKSKYTLGKLSFLAYKSFYSLISLKRFFSLNILISIIIIIIAIIKLDKSLVIFLLVFAVIEIVSFIFIKNYYPIKKIKILETSLKI